MFKYAWAPVVLLLLVLAVGIAVVTWWPDRDLEIALTPTDNAVVAIGRSIYAEHCASCHGANLEGQPNWRQRDGEGYLPAPPHDASGHTWHHADKQLFELTKYGLGAVLGDKSFKTRMPVYKDILSDVDVIAVLSYIKSRWPKEIQQRHDKLNAARRRSD